MSQHSRPTSEFSHDLLHCPSPGVGVSMGTVSSDQVVGQINRCFNTNCASFLKVENKDLELLNTNNRLPVVEQYIYI